MKNKINFFGYGANRDILKIQKILGKIPAGGNGAVLANYALCYQRLNQIPEPAKGLLNDVWGEYFKSYTIVPGNGIVAGVIWEIEESDLELIKEWEFVGTWREIISIKVELFDSNQIDCVTEKAINTELVEASIDSLNYLNNLNSDTYVTDVEKNQEDLYRIDKLIALRKQLTLVTQKPK